MRVPDEEVWVTHNREAKSSEQTTSMIRPTMGRGLRSVPMRRYLKEPSSHRWASGKTMTDESG